MTVSYPPSCQGFLLHCGPLEGEGEDLGCFLTVFSNVTRVTILRTGSQVQENLADQSGSELDQQPRRTHAVALDVSPLRNKGLSLHFIAQLLTNYIRATVQITS